MRTLTTFYLLLFFTFSLIAQYTIQEVHPSDGMLCNGFIFYTIPSEGGKVDLELFLLNPLETLVDNRYSTSGYHYFDRLCPGDYILRIKDSFGCSKDLMVTVAGACNTIQLVNQPAIYPASSCEANGEIHFNGTNPAQYYFSGLINPVDFEWSNGEEGPVIKELSSGNYKLTVTDAKRCSKSFEFTVPGDNEVITVQTFSTPTCAGMAMGEATALASSPSTSGPVEYLFFWPHNEQTDRGIASSVPNVEAGTYTVNVSNLDGSCPVTAQVTVEELENNEQLSFTLGQSIPSCDNSSSGTFEINILGGVPDFKISSSKGNPYLSGSQIVQLSPGQQILTLTDFCGNTISQEVDVEVFDPFKVFITEKGFENCDPNKGIIRFEGNKSFTIYRQGNLFYSQPIPNSNNRHFLKIGFIEAGTYDFYVSDENGCTHSFIDIDLKLLSNNNQNSPLTIFNEALNCEEGNIYPIILGGTPPYTLTWELNNEIVSTEPFLTGADNGVYTLTVKDACFKKTEKVIDFNCECSAQFRWHINDPCDNEFFHSYFLSIKKLKELEKLPSGQYSLKWISPFQDKATMIIDNNGDGDWNGKYKVNRPETGVTYKIELSDPRGCIFSEEIEIVGPDKDIISEVPVPDTTITREENLLSFFTENPADDFLVATSCRTFESCNRVLINETNGFQETFERFHYEPEEYGANACNKGTITCPNDPDFSLEINVPGIPYAINNGPDKCGCLWYPDNLPFPADLPVLAIFDCDGGDLTIDINVLIAEDYFPEEECDEIVYTNQNNLNCTATISCMVNGIEVTQPITNAVTGDYKWYATECNDGVANTLYIYQECGDGSCSERIIIKEYKGAGGINNNYFQDQRRANSCNNIEKGLYRKLCKDLNSIEYDDSCPDYFHNKLGCDGLTEDPPIEGFPGGTTGNNGSETPTTAIQLFPNPTSGSTTLQFTKDAREFGYQISIFDIYGKPVFEETLDEVTALDMVTLKIHQTSEFAPGIYLVEVYGIILKEKLVARLVVQ